MQNKFKGIYSTPKGQRVWSGARLVVGAPTTTDKVYWIVWTGAKGKNVIQACTESLETHGETLPVAEKDVQESFNFEEELTAEWANLEPVGGSVFVSKKTVLVNSSHDDSSRSGGQAVETKMSPIATAKAASQVISTAAASQKNAEAQTIQFGSSKQEVGSLTIVKGSGLAPENPSVSKKTAPAVSDSAAQPAYNQQEKVMRTEFAMALARLRLGQREKAREQVENLLDKPGDFQPVHRHMFTEFGINLRKSKMPDLALRTHMKALDLGPTDSHIHFNAARACFDLGQYAEAKKHLDKALEIAPDLEPALRFLKYMNKNGKI